MTTPSPASVARADRRSVAHRRLRSIGSVTLAALLTVAGGAAAAASAEQATPSAETISATAVEASAAITFGLAAEGDGIVGADGRLRISLSVVNQTGASIEATTADLAVSGAPLTSRAAVDAWLDGTASPRLRDLSTAPVSTVPSLSATTASTTLDVGDDLTPGVYALRGTYPSPRGTLVSRSVFVVADDDAGDVAVIVPITAGPLSTGLLDTDELAELTGPEGSLRAQVDAVTGTPAILAVDPAVVAAIRVLGTTAPDSAREWLDDLLALPNSRFALQFGDADLGVQFAAGETEPLAVTSLSASVVDAGVTATPSPTETPEPDADPDAPMQPDVAALTDIGASRENVFWPADGTAGSDVVAALGALSDASLTLMRSDAVGGESGARARSGDADLLVYDADVSDALATASSATRRIDRTAALATASAYASFSAPSRTLLVTIDRGEDRTAAALRTAVRAATRLDGRDAVGLSPLTTATPVARVSVAAVEEDPERVRALETFLDDESELERFGSILEDPEVLTGPERTSVLQLIGNGWLSHPDAWDTAVDTHLGATRATLDAVAIVPSPDINLLGSSAPLTFSVRNDLPWPVTVIFVAEPNDPRLVVQRTTDVAAGAAQTTRVDVPVEARVGNGRSSLDLSLRSPTMVAIGDPTTVVVSVRAEWEAVGITVMAVLVGTLLVLGVVRTVLRLRRRRSPAPDGGDAAEGEDVDG